MHTLLLRTATVRRARRAHPKVVLTDERGRTVELPYAAVEVDLSGVTPTWEELPRPGRSPLLAVTGRPLRRLRGTFTVGWPDPQRDVEDRLHGLRAIARDGVRVRWVGYGPSEHGWWHIEDFTQRATGRQHGSNRVTRAEVTVTLMEAPAQVGRIGPLSGGARSTPARRAGTEPATHVVAAGDTLIGLAHRYYGDGSRWTEIAAASGVRDPRRITVGTRLTVP